MLKRISTAQVTVGMFLQSVEGSWLSHPFWKARFLITDPADLELLKRSGVPAVWIDTSKGRDVGEPAVAAVEPAADTPPAPVAAPPARPEPPAAAAPAAPADVAVSLPEEIGRAAEVLNRSKQAVMALFNEARLGKAVDTMRCLEIVDDVASSLARNPSAFISLARLKTKDNYTYMHSVAVCGLMVTLARQMGLSDAEVRDAGLAGLLHDVGKMQMPLEVLNKPGALTDAEFRIMRSHPERGYELLKDSPQVPPVALDVCLHHHEKIDGTGYPHRLNGDQISLMARMGAVCDVYDAITSTRPYKGAWDPAASLNRMAQWKGHFDPAVFQAFVKSVGIYPIGAVVRLASGRVGVVIDQHSASLVTPVVKVFYSTKSSLPIPVQVVDLAEHADRIVGREPPEKWPQAQELWMPAAA